MVPQAQARYGIKITTVDPSQGLVKGVMKGDSQERTISVYTIPDAFRWPQVGEAWMVAQKNGTWYLDGAFTTTGAAATAQDANPGDMSITAPSGVVRVIGSPDGSTDFVLRKPVGHLKPSLSLRGSLATVHTSVSQMAKRTLVTL